MSIGVFSIYGKIFLSYSSVLIAFSVFSVQAKILLAYSEKTLCKTTLKLPLSSYTLKDIVQPKKRGV
jgi:hypothetical protein